VDTPGVQIAAPDGTLVAFKRPCMGCGEYFPILDNGHCHHCNGTTVDQKLEKLRALAVGQADQAIRIMGMAGHWAEAWGLGDAQVADFAAKAARQCYRLCLKHQLGGGHPASGGRKL
jgi:hypothetical protein